MFCKTCGSKLDDDALFCMNCGVKVSGDTSSKYCAHCGNELEADAVFCMGCGKRIHISEPQPEVEKPAEIEEEGNLAETSEKNLTAEEKESSATENKVESENVAEEKLAEQDAQNDEPITDVEVEKPVIEKETVEQSELKLEFRDAYVNGKHFVYIDDSSKVFCPKCHKRVDINATMCSNCNTNFVISTESPSESEVSWRVQKIDFEKTGEKSPCSTTNSATRDNEKNYGLLIAIIFIVLSIFVGSLISKNLSTPVQNSSSSFTSNDTFNFDVLKPYTFNYSDEWDSYEFDCYSLSKGTLSNLWNNPPRYFTYNTKKYEVDNRNIDYDDVDENDNEYNAIIFWGDYDGTYYHFLGVEIKNGRKIMWLRKL